MRNIKTEIDKIIRGIKDISNENNIVVAFSGGLDSSVALFLTREALGKERIMAVNVDFGDFSYNFAAHNVEAFCQEMQIKLYKISGEKQQREMMRGGPDCNLCTKKIKLGLIKDCFKNRLIFTGSNQSDSWGKYGTAFSSGFYAPMFSYGKDEIKEIADFLNIKVRRIGENSLREGCKLKHLLKPLINPSFHGKAVSLANEILLKEIKELDISCQIANVKIIGPLNKNIALINIFPIPEEEWKLKIIVDRISSIKEIEVSEIVSQPLRLIIKANKGQFNNLRSRYWIEQGRLQPEFAVSLEFRWLLTTNSRLKTFQVVDYNCYKL